MLTRAFILNWAPGLRTLNHYEKDWLMHDVTAGLVLATVLVPVGIAYATASGLPGICGLYATIAPLLAYAVFGPSGVLVLGPDSSLAAVILGVVLPLAGQDSERAIAIGSMMAIVAGAICLLAGIVRLGFVTELLSKPIRYGYMNGIALVVVISQLPKALGFTIQNRGPLRDLWMIGQMILLGRTNLAAFAIAVASLFVILLLRPIKRVPGVLIAVIVATLIAAHWNLEMTAGVSVLGPLAGGLPRFAIPSLSFEDFAPVLIGGGAAALVSFADTSVLSRVYAGKSNRYVDPNQEMVGLGMANVAAGLFRGFPISSSSSRTPVAESAGARTQLAGVVGAVAVTGVVLMPGLLWHLPVPALAAVVIASAIGLFELRDLRRIYCIQRWEFWLSILCLAGVAAFGAIPGIGLAVIVAIVEFLWDGWRPYSAVLGRVDGVEGYHDITRYSNARQISGLVILRWDAPLFFANAELFRQRVLQLVAMSSPKIKWLLVAAEPITSVDVTASDILGELHDTLARDGVKLCFAQMKDPVKDKIRRFNLLEQIGEDRFFPTIGVAVKNYISDRS